MCLPREEQSNVERNKKKNDWIDVSNTRQHHLMHLIFRNRVKKNLFIAIGFWIKRFDLRVFAYFVAKKKACINDAHCYILIHASIRMRKCTQRWIQIYTHEQIEMKLTHLSWTKWKSIGTIIRYTSTSFRLTHYERCWCRLWSDALIHWLVIYCNNNNKTDVKELKCKLHIKWFNTVKYQETSSTN